MLGKDVRARPELRSGDLRVYDKILSDHMYDALE
jgi:hypothetical protein